MFEVGDRVRRINEDFTGVQVGKIYTVAKVYNEGLDFEGEGMTGYLAKNFEFAEARFTIKEISVIQKQYEHELESLKMWETGGLHSSESTGEVVVKDDHTTYYTMKDTTKQTAQEYRDKCDLYNVILKKMSFNTM